MSKKNVEPERVRKGPMTVEEIKAMRAAEGMIVDLEDEGTNVYIIKAYQEKMSVAVGRMYKQARREMAERCLTEIAKQEGVVSEFDEDLWYALVDFVTVCGKDDVRFTFKDGTEIKV